MTYYGSENPSSLGVQNGAARTTANENALFLKVFSGEVLTTFEANNIMMPLHRVRTISSGKSAQFPVTGVAEAKYHTPGESLFGDEQTTGSEYLSHIKHNERIIHIDGVLTASSFLADIDEAKNHYEVRSIYSTEIGRQLAYNADKASMRTVLAGAVNGITNNDRFGNSWAELDRPYHGAVIAVAQEATNTAVSTGYVLADNAVNVTLGATGAATSTADKAQNMIRGFFTAARLMDQKNVSDQGRIALLTPANYYALINENKDAINRDYGNEGNGSVAGGNIVSVAGIRVMKSNHIPSTDESSNALLGNAQVRNDLFGTDTGYAYDASGIEGLIFQTEGVGTVKLLDLAMESEYFMERLGTMLMAKYAMGHGVLREECCYALKTLQTG
jgi:hypothetical protein